MELKIGVMDSGVGGLTVVEQLQKQIPEATILYYGNSANCPYGNRSKAQIVELAGKVLRILEKQGVSFVCIACNTISTVIDELQQMVTFPLICIIQPVAHYIATELKPSKVGVIATVATIHSGIYQHLIQSQNLAIEVVGQGSPNLANWIEQGMFDAPEIDEEIKKEMQKILSHTGLRTVILGCTHYPIIEDHFQKLYPGVTFINPAYSMVREVIQKYLKDPVNIPTPKEVQLYTSGDPATFEMIADKIGLQTTEKTKQQLL